jgi:adenylate kinase family enzyme
MNLKPYLLVVTGRPGSGKTTFAKTLGSEIFMPVISRDQINEGYVHTFGKKHAELPPETNKIVTELFFDTLMGLVSSNVSVIAEAAFQRKLWSDMLERFIEKVRIYLLICKINDRLAVERFINRGLENPLREYFHGDKGVDMARKGIIDSNVVPYEEPQLDVPTFHVDTSGEYNPSIKELWGKIMGLEIKKKTDVI